MLVWEWNKVDLAQFDMVGDPGFTFAAVAREAPAIRMINPTIGDGFSALLLKPEEVDLSLYEGKQLLIDFRIDRALPIGIQDVLFFPYYVDTEHFCAVRFSVGSPILTMRNGSTAWVDMKNRSLGPWPIGKKSSLGIRYVETNNAPRVHVIRSTTYVPDASCIPRSHHFLPIKDYATSWSNRKKPRLGFGVRSFSTTMKDSFISEIRIQAIAVGAQCR